MIEINNLTKLYGDFVALQNFNLKIPKNSIFGLVGINGAGKSTLLRLLSGVYKPSCGEVLIEGENVYENERIKRKIFFLPDDLHYSPSTTAQQMAELYKAFYGFDNEIFYGYLGEFKLDTRLPLRSYSKGMKRQLFVCLAFATKPKYLFLDEAFDGLDPNARLIFKRGLIRTMENGGSAIISSHSLRELEDICDSYGIIDGKKIISYGSLSDSLENTYKFQVAFNEPVEQSDLGFDCVSFEKNGRIIKFVVTGDKDGYLQKINRLNPLLVDELPIDFEEFFISKTQGRNK